MSTSLKVMAYNTHLAGNFLAKTPFGWNDETRFQALKSILKDQSNNGEAPDIISFEEMWSSDFVHRLHHDSFYDHFPAHYYNYDYYKPPRVPIAGVALLPPVIPSNPCGLSLHAKSRVTFDTKHASYFDFIGRITMPPDYFDIQDITTAKGFLMVPATVDNVPITIFSTHMPTNSGTYFNSLDRCFKELAKAVSAVNTPVVLLGDFNLREDAGLVDNKINRYATWIGPEGYLGQAGLIDVYRSLNPDSENDPGYTVIGNTNNCWKHFNGSDAKDEKYDFQRIDYVMCKGMTPLSMEVQGDYIGKTGTDYVGAKNAKTWTWYDKDDTGDPNRDISDHYPVIATLTIP